MIGICPTPSSWWRTPSWCSTTCSIAPRSSRAWRCRRPRKRTSCAGCTPARRRGSSAGWSASLHPARCGRSTSSADPPLPQAGSPYPDERFQQDVRRIKEYIAAGDTFQTVLSRRIDVAAPDPFLSYRYLRALNPAPYLYYLHCDDIHVIGSSPEILVRVEDGEVTVRPIAGTRPRGADAAQDAALADELTADPKERAEHLMLVDLGRNDVGTGGGVRLGAAHGVHDDRAVLARDAPGERGPGTAPARARRGRRAGGLLSGGNGVGGAQGAGDADHRRAGAGPAGSLRRGGGLRRLGRAHARHRHRHPHLCHPRRPGLGAGRGGNRRGLRSGRGVAGDGSESPGGAARAGVGGKRRTGTMSP